MRRELKFTLAGTAAVLAIAAGGCTTPGTTLEYASQSLAANKELTADSNMTANLRRTATTSTTSTNFAVRKNGSGGVDVNVAGKSMSFTGSDVAGNAWVKNGDPRQVAAVFPSASTGDVTNGNQKKYAQVWQYFHRQAGVEINEGFGVVGNMTPSTSLPTNTTVNYSGTAGVILANNNARAVALYGTPEAKAVNPASEARLTANFTNRTISGQLSGAVGASTDALGTLNGALAPLGGSLTLGTSAIANDGRYSGGAVSGDIQGNTAGNGSTYSGAFFGPNAEETAGVLKIDFGNGISGVGAFHADKQ